MILDVADDDTITTNLARVLLVCEIAAQVLAVFMVAEMMGHGSLGYKIDWYMKKARQKLESYRAEQRTWRRSLGLMLYEAQRTLEESQHG